MGVLDIDLPEVPPFDAGVDGAPDGGMTEGGTVSEAGSEGGARSTGSEDDGGCGCRTSPSRGGTMWLWVALSVLLLRRRNARSVQDRG